MTDDERAAELLSVTKPNGSTDPVPLLSLVLHQLSSMESRILAQMAENARQAQGRWTVHESEHKEMTKALKLLEARFNDHLEEARNEELVMEARLGPIRSAATLVAREWRTILIVALIAWNMLQHAAFDLLASLLPH